MRKQQERGYILVGVIVLIALSLLIVSTSLDISSTDTRAMAAQRTRAENYYSAEASLNRAASWLRDNSTSLALMFSRTNFYSHFDRVPPSAGTNDLSDNPVPSELRIIGTDNAPILSSSSILANSAFPETTDALTGDDFSPTTVFQSATLGDSLVRITLVDAIPIDPTKDFGDPDLGNPVPETDFHPVYRIDSMMNETQGAHVSAYLIGALVIDSGLGFFGRDYLEFRQPCDSYQSNAGPYSDTSKRANCAVGSHGEMRIHDNEAVYGSGRTTGAILTDSPWGGDVCADFSCTTQGTTCQGPTCLVPGLPTYSSWEDLCPVNQGNVTINASQELTVAGNDPSQRCWATITVNNNKVLTLSSTNYSYFIHTFNIANNGRINFAPNPSTGTINLYVRKFEGDTFNGNQVYNINNKPYQLRIHYLGTDDLTMNGTADMNAFVVAPYAGVTVSGNFTFAGGIKATDLTMTGSGDVHYDESGDVATVSDSTYSLRNVSERYR
ncbi:MAG: hypothetical protein QY326_08975 [Bdellovibrionota bacterium]|nr:MAG: hypothetical protein QY326_08975 [Bdellovibrionota bacterium]